MSIRKDEWRKNLWAAPTAKQKELVWTWVRTAKDPTAAGRLVRWSTRAVCKKFPVSQSTAQRIISEDDDLKGYWQLGLDGRVRPPR